MNHPRIKFCLCVLIIAGLSVLRCVAPSLSGGSSDQGNSMVIGKLVDETGAGAVSAQVRLLPASFNPLSGDSAAQIDTTDKNGMYVFTNINTGDYTLEAVQLEKRTRSFVGGIRVAGDTFDVRDKRLEQPGAITIMLPPGLSGAKGYLFIPGTTASVDLKGDNNFATLDSLPPAAGLSIWYATVNNPDPRILHGNVTVLSGQTTTIFNPEWSHSRKLYLNTTASGAGVTGTVVNFPVLIRLDGNTFDFTQARNNGEDIRFTKQDNAFLSYEIERWDPIGKKAEIWVKVDTIRGSDSSQSIMMYWGNATVAGNSSGPAVFDSMSGFEGVWHLGETSGRQAADASHHGYAGAYKGGLPSDVTGPFGICQSIVHSDSDFVEMGNVLNPGMNNISISVWVKRTAFGSPQALIAKTNGDTPAASYGYELSIDPYNYPSFHIASGGAAWGDDGSFNFPGNLAISDSTTWHYIGVVIDRLDNGNCKMYIDGIDRTGSTQGNIANVASVSNALRLHIGTESDNNCSYKGAIGEATIAFTMRSADWVKLSYMNQKEQDALVKW